jgi:hypothetical protein
MKRSNPMIFDWHANVCIFCVVCVEVLKAYARYVVVASLQFALTLLWGGCGQWAGFGSVEKKVHAGSELRKA